MINSYTNEINKREQTQNVVFANIKPKRSMSKKKFSKRLKRVDSKSKWGQTRNKLFQERGYRCETCLSDNSLHIHHIKHVSLGGTNESKNLIILCEACHEREHGKSFHYNTFLDGNYGESKKVISNKVKLINKAIKLNNCITIIYKKEDGTTTERKIKPVEVYRKFFGRIYLEAFCYLRNDKRTFRISRIININ